MEVERVERERERLVNCDEWRSKGWAGGEWSGQKIIINGDGSRQVEKGGKRREDFQAQTRDQYDTESADLPSRD
jgi:hypothetical protein